MTALVSRDPEKKKNAAEALARLHSKSGPAMQKRILQDLAENQMEELALTLIPESSTDPDSVLRKCDLLVFLGRHAEASKLIQGIYASDDFTTSQKYRAVYLLAAPAATQKTRQSYTEQLRDMRRETIDFECAHLPRTHCCARDTPNRGSTYFAGIDCPRIRISNCFHWYCALKWSATLRP
jgi:hypothetical protein